MQTVLNSLTEFARSDSCFIYSYYLAINLLTKSDNRYDYTYFYQTVLSGSNLNYHFIAFAGYLATFPTYPTHGNSRLHINATHLYSYIDEGNSDVQIYVCTLVGMSLCKSTS